MLQKIVNAPTRKYTPIGELWCDQLECGIFVGIKKRMEVSSDRPLHEVAVAEALLRGDPNLRRAIPCFTIGVVDKNGPIGLLTEDFSANGLYDLEESVTKIPVFAHGPQDIPEGFHRQVFEAIGGQVYANAFGRMAAVVCRKSVLIDFDEIVQDDHASVREIYAEAEKFRDLAFVSMDEIKSKIRLP